MKLTQDERENLARRIRQMWEKSTFSISKLASVSKVDPGQTSRILDGKFKTVSGNVLQICNVLGVDTHSAVTETPTPDHAATRAAWAKLEASIRRAWDETPQGAERLARVIDAIAQVQGR